MYILGNATQLSNNSDVWRDVIKTLGKKKLCDESIDLYCCKHSKLGFGLQGLVAIRAEWEADTPSEGGCKQKCGEIMSCGHVSSIKKSFILSS